MPHPYEWQVQEAKQDTKFKFDNLLDSDVGMGVCSKHFYYYLFSRCWAIKDKITI